MERPGREYGNIVLHLGPRIDRWTDEEFAELCRVNRDLRLERTADGDLIIMPPTGGETGRRNLELALRLGEWAKREGSGVAFDSSTGFRLPNGAHRSPDASWIVSERWNALSQEAREGFPPLCPDFVVELRSPTDPLAHLQAKMQEFVDNGARLGWLIDPFERRVHVYRPETEPVELDEPETIAGEPVLPGFALDLALFWGPLG
jgi:Uma2 family endonuclease